MMRRLLASVILAAMFAVSALPGAGRYAVASEASPIQAQLQEHLSYFDLSSDELITVIVRLAAEPASTHAGAYKNQGQAVAEAARNRQLQQVRNERAQAVASVKSRINRATIEREYEEAYNGFAVTLPASQIPWLAAIPGVTGIFADLEIVRNSSLEDLVPATAEEAELATSVPAVGAPVAWAQGITGRGVTVAIIDDGVDYTHPDLGGCIGPGCKVIGGYNFVNLTDDPQQDPGDYHGTHVAGIAAGRYGVAPDANILAVKVLGTNNRNNLATVMSGIDYAVKMKADAANMSLGLGSVVGPSDSPWAEMVANAVKAGMVFTNSNGNNGPSYWIANPYGASPYNIGTGNADARRLPFPKATLVGTGQVIIGGAYGATFPAEMLGVEIDLVDVGHGNAPSDYAGKDVAGKIAIAQRGGPGDATFVNKGEQALAAGAAGLIIYNHETGWGDFSTAALAVPSFTMSYPNGLAAVASPRIILENHDAGIQMAGGSSKGPTIDMEIKPDVSAPGTGIVSTVPCSVSPSCYASASGTSMAAPHALGAAALMLQARPDLNPHQVKLSLMNTALDLTDLWGNQYRVLDQGSGFLSVERMLNARLSVSPGNHSFGHLYEGNSQASKTFTVDTYVTGGRYAISVAPLGGVTPVGISVTTDKGEVHLTGRNRTHTFAVNVSIDEALAQPGEYEGYVYLTNIEDPSDSYRVPYFFVYRAPIGAVKTSSNYIGVGERESLEVSFSVGRNLANWYLGGASSATRYTANQGPKAPGSYTITWNGRTSAGAQLGATAVGSSGHVVAIYYQLEGESVWRVSQSYVRVLVDRTAPQVRVDAAPPALTNNPSLTITGAVSDTSIHAHGAVGGKVFVNGQSAQFFFRTPALAFTNQNSEMGYSATVGLTEGQNTITVYAEDSAGNKSAVQTFEVVLDTRAELTLTNLPEQQYRYNSTTLTVEGATENGAVVTINGTTVTLGEENTFAHQVTLTNGMNILMITATDLAGNTTTLERRITVQGQGGAPTLTPIR